MALDLLEPRPGERILDAGCGSGAALAELLHRAPVRSVGLDPSPTMLNLARRRLGPGAQLHGTTIEAMPFMDGAFDAAIALNVLYFCGDDAAMVAQIHRVLRPGGRLVAYITHRDSMEAWSFAREGVHRLYDQDELRSLIVAGGFAQRRVRVHERAITNSIRGAIRRGRKGRLSGAGRRLPALVAT
ncbi:class I SAM-dependent methyltransferase [Novosphingobium colocasiae]